MVIGFNAKAAFTKNRTGVDEYVYWLIRTLIQKDRGHQFIFYTDQLSKIKTVSDIFGTKLPDFIQIKIMPAKYLWTQGRLAYELYKNPPDVFFTPTHVLPFSAPKRSVVTIHDLAYEYYPELYNPFSPFGLHYLRYVTKYAAHKAAKIIAVSENTKYDLIKIYQVPQNKITVIYHGVPNSNTLPKINQDIFDQKNKFSKIIENEYILFIGRIELKKNIKNLVRAFNLLKEKLASQEFGKQKKCIKNIKLILMGDPGYGYNEILKFIDQSPYRKDIFLTGHLQDQEKEIILKNASLLALTSYYEGFGFPVVEAQNFGIPVVCSFTSSLPEIAGQGALFVEPNDVQLMASSFERIISDSLLRAKLIKKGFENVRRFSWQKCIDQTLEALLNWNS